MAIVSTSQLCGKKVFTNKGSYYGETVDVILSPSEFKISGLKIVATPNSLLAKTLGGTKRGVIVPYSLVQAIGDVVIVEHVIKTEEEEEVEEAK